MCELKQRVYFPIGTCQCEISVQALHKPTSSTFELVYVLRVHALLTERRPELNPTGRWNEPTQGGAAGPVVCVLSLNNTPLVLQCLGVRLWTWSKAFAY